MCARVLLASSKPLPLVPVDATRPSFSVRPAADGDPVRKRFSLAHVYELGSCTGCACGLTYWPDELMDPGDREASRRDLAELHAYLRSAPADTTLEIFTCWYGEELEEHVPELDLPPEALDGRNLGVLDQPYFIRVRC